MKRFSLPAPSPAKASEKTSVVRYMWRRFIAGYEFRGNHQQILRRIYTIARQGAGSSALSPEFRRCGPIVLVAG